MNYFETATMRSKAPCTNFFSFGKQFNYPYRVPKSQLNFSTYQLDPNKFGENVKHVSSITNFVTISDFSTLYQLDPNKFGENVKYVFIHHKVYVTIAIA